MLSEQVQSNTEKSSKVFFYSWLLIVSVCDRFASFMSECTNTLDKRRHFESGTFLIRRHYCDVWYIHVDVLDVNVPASGPCSFMDSTHVFYSLDSLIHFYIHTHILWGSPPVCWVKKFPPVSGSVVLDHGAMTWCLFLDYPGMWHLSIVTLWKGPAHTVTQPVCGYIYRVGACGFLWMVAVYLELCSTVQLHPNMVPFSHVQPTKRVTPSI